MESEDYQSIVDGLFKCFGEALAEWSRIEAYAYRFYFAMMDGANRHLISVNWHNIQSFDSKITLLDRCAFFALPDDVYEKEWTPIFKRMRDASAERNAIAHAAIMSRVQPDFSLFTYFGASIFDATAKIRKRLENGKYEYDAARLRELSKSFNNLAAALDALTRLHFPHSQIEFAY